MAKVNSGRIHAQKHRIDRRQKINLWGRAKSPVNKRPYGLGQHGQTLRNKLTDYGKQLQAKQRIKAYYGNITEKKFLRYYKEAAAKSGDTVANLIASLESRLDVIVYRAKFAVTVFSARQLVSHGHILVNGKRVTIGSYQCKAGDIITLKDKARNIPFVLTALSSPERDFCEYVAVDLNKFEATYAHVPTLEEVPYPVQMEPHMVIEFYSRQ